MGAGASDRVGSATEAAAATGSVPLKRAPRYERETFSFGAG
jgi:hypothetical protein